MDKLQIKKLFESFNDAAKDLDGIEVWYARDLQGLLGYDQWKNFEKVVEKAKTACKNALNNEMDHFADVGKMIEAGKGAIREVDDIVLTRYACYLIAMEADSRKQQVAFAKTYFATQARKFELLEKAMFEFDRIAEREKLAGSEKIFSKVMYEAGVDGVGMARIRSQGDEALFTMKTADLKKKHGIHKDRPVGDFIHPLALSAKEFAARITAYNTEALNLESEQAIAKEHIYNNSNARDMLIKGGIKPEDLPAQDDVKKVTRKVNSERKKIAKGNKTLNPLLIQNRKK